MTEDDDTDLEEDIALAAEYALGLLTPPEAEAFEARLAVDPAFRDLYARWAEDLAALTDDLPEVAPPPRVQAAIEGRLFAQPARRGLFGRFGLPALLGATAVAGVLAVVLNLGSFAPVPEGPLYRAEIAAEDGSLRVIAAYDPATEALRIERVTGSAPAGRVLELWLIAGDAAPASLGVLPEAATAVIPVPDALRAGLAGGVLAISEEPVGGSPTGAPTGEVLALGPVAPA